MTGSQSLIGYTSISAGSRYETALKNRAYDEPGKVIDEMIDVEED